MDRSIDVYVRRLDKYKFPVLTRERERELIKRYQSGDKIAGDQLFDESIRLLLHSAGSFSRRYGISMDEAFNALVEAFLVMRNKYDLTHPKRPRIMTIVSKCFLGYLRKNRGRTKIREPEVYYSDESPEPVYSWDPSTMIDIRKKLNALTKPTQRVIMSSVYHGQLNRAGNALGCTKENVRQHVKRVTEKFGGESPFAKSKK